MSKYADFLVEIQTEELPPKALHRLGKTFLQEIEDRLRKADLKYDVASFFATPRRLAVFITNLASKQADAVVERKGPAIDAAFDQNRKPTQACMGFARSCGVNPEQLITIKNDGGAWVGFKQKVIGKSIHDLLPGIVQQALTALPIPKRMRWGNNTAEFVRPVHSIIMLYGSKVVTAEILGCKAGRKTRGHRFLSKGWLEIKKPSDYLSVLENKGFVIADFERRKELIRQEAEALAAKNPALDKTGKKKIIARALIDETLLDEVAGLVEWPVAIYGSFDKNFLTVPQEALICAMQDHQRYFPVVDEKGKLLPHFIAMSNIASKDTSRVIEGNERVLRARLADAAFFFETDKKETLESRVNHLKQVIYQAKLGTLYDKSQRLSQIAGHIAKQLGADVEAAKRIGYLAKADLTSALVGEFPELQGIAGYYYALNDGIAEPLAKALNEQYMPRFSGGPLPTTALGYALAIADRLDTLIGVFGINQIPTGDKDPFGLRRAALGILRIIIDKKLELDLRELLQFTLAQYSIPLENTKVVEDVANFILERLKPWYQEQGVAPDVYAAVAAVKLTAPYDIHRRIQAVQAFKKLTEAESLSIANKRVSNILTQYKKEIALKEIDEKLFEHDAERTLAKKLKEQQQTITALSKSGQYRELLSQLAHLRKPVDDFFDHVMVMTEDKATRENRLLMLKRLRELFLHVADIALLT
ncbi:MAG: glycine--tRNA ligase subunit beta [Gammaproteobacteria bacterium]